MGTNAWSRRTGSIGYGWHRQVVDGDHLQSMATTSSPTELWTIPLAHSGTTIWLHELSKS